MEMDEVIKKLMAFFSWFMTVALRLWGAIKTMPSKGHGEKNVSTNHNLED
jgi:hypothetical protein